MSNAGRDVEEAARPVHPDGGGEGPHARHSHLDGLLPLVFAHVGPGRKGVLVTKMDG